MDLAGPNPVNGEVFSQMSFLVVVHGAASALAQGTSLGFFSHFFLLQASGGDAAMAGITQGRLT